MTTSNKSYVWTFEEVRTVIAKADASIAEANLEKGRAFSAMESLTLFKPKYHSLAQCIESEFPDYTLSRVKMLIAYARFHDEHRTELRDVDLSVKDVMQLRRLDPAAAKNAIKKIKRADNKSHVFVENLVNEELGITSPVTPAKITVEELLGNRGAAPRTAMAAVSTVFEDREALINKIKVDVDYYRHWLSTMTRKEWQTLITTVTIEEVHSDNNEA